MSSAFIVALYQQLYVNVKLSLVKLSRFSNILQDFRAIMYFYELKELYSNRIHTLV
jgi:hypothetical protein